MIGLALALGFLGGMLLHDSGGGTILVFPIIASAVLCAVLLDGWRMRAVVVTTLILLALGALRGHQSATASTPVITTVVGSDGAVEATV